MTCRAPVEFTAADLTLLASYAGLMIGLVMAAKLADLPRVSRRQRDEAARLRIARSWMKDSDSGWALAGALMLLSPVAASTLPAIASVAVVLGANKRRAAARALAALHEEEAGPAFEPPLPLAQPA